MSDLLNQASLVYIPSGYKEDTAYSVIPTDGSGDLTFTRASDGTRVNSSGLVENVPWNLVTYSEQFDNVAWTKSNASISANSTTAPNGTTTADLIVDDIANASHYVTQTISISNSQLISVSIYIKEKDLRYAGLRLFVPTNGVGVGRFSIVIDLQTGNITSTLASGQVIANLSYNVTSVGNGWYRAEIIGTSPAGAAGFMVWTSNSATPTNDGFSTTNYIGTGVGFYIWGAQLNTGTTAKPYFPTTDRQNVPRLTYEGGCPSLLLEPQRTNLVTYSEQLDNAAWATTNTSVTANATTSPDGTANADLLTDGTANSDHYININVTTASSTTYIQSAWFKKKDSGIYASLRTNGVGPDFFVVFDFDTGSIVGVGSQVSDYGVDSYANGWYRVWMEYTAAPSGYIIGVSNSSSSSIPIYTGTNKGFYIWGAQLEAGSYPTSYIPTTSAAVTRVADTAQILSMGSSVASGATSGTVFLEMEYINEIANDAFCFGQNNSFYPAGRGYIYNKTSGFADSFGGGGFTVPENQNVKIIYRLNSLSSGNIFQNGVKGATRTGTAWASIEQIAIRGAFASMKVKQMAFFPTALTDAECIELTTL